MTTLPQVRILTSGGSTEYATTQLAVDTAAQLRSEGFNVVADNLAEFRTPRPTLLMLTEFNPDQFTIILRQRSGRGAPTFAGAVHLYREEIEDHLTTGGTLPDMVTTASRYLVALYVAGGLPERPEGQHAVAIPWQAIKGGE